MCEYCQKLKRIELHRKENLLCSYKPFIAICEDGAGLFFENPIGDPAYIDINYCPICGRKLEPRVIRHEPSE